MPFNDLFLMYQLSWWSLRGVLAIRKDLPSVVTDFQAPASPGLLEQYIFPLDKRGTHRVPSGIETPRYRDSSASRSFQTTDGRSTDCVA